MKRRERERERKVERVQGVFARVCEKKEREKEGKRERKR